MGEISLSLSLSPPFVCYNSIFSYFFIRLFISLTLTSMILFNYDVKYILPWVLSYVQISSSMIYFALSFRYGALYFCIPLVKWIWLSNCKYVYDGIHVESHVRFMARGSAFYMYMYCPCIDVNDFRNRCIAILHAFAWDRWIS